MFRLVESRQHLQSNKILQITLYCKHHRCTLFVVLLMSFFDCAVDCVEEERREKMSLKSNVACTISTK